MLKAAAAAEPRGWKLAEEKAAERTALDAALANRDAPMITGHVAAICRKVFADDAVVIFDTQRSLGLQLDLGPQTQLVVEGDLNAAGIDDLYFISMALPAKPVRIEYQPVVVPALQGQDPKNARDYVSYGVRQQGGALCA